VNTLLFVVLMMEIVLKPIASLMAQYKQHPTADKQPLQQLETQIYLQQQVVIVTRLQLRQIRKMFVMVAAYGIHILQVVLGLLYKMIVLGYVLAHTLYHRL